MFDDSNTLVGPAAANSSLLGDDDTIMYTSSTTATTTTILPNTKITTSTTTTTPSVRPNLPPKKKSKKRTRIPDFTIFIDPPVASSPAPKKPKTNTRIPLGPRSPNTPSRPSTPVTPSTPFFFSATDAFWTDIENFDPRPPTPPPPTSPPRASTARGPGQAPPPLPPRSPVPPSAPRSMALYDLLGVTDWRASTDEIAAAWRRAALENHPDHVGEEDKEAATRMMQRINAAKEVLCDEERRRRYNVDGVVPWSEEE